VPPAVPPAESARPLPVSADLLPASGRLRV